MAKTDFDFAGSTNGNASSTQVWEKYVGIMHTAIGDTDGATSGAQGNPVTNSTLSDPLPTGIGSTHCRAWSIEDTNTGYNSNTAGIGVAMIKSSAGGSLYPVTDTPSNGTFVAITQRAFLRVQTYDFVSKSLGTSNASGAANVGFTFKTRDATGNQGAEVGGYNSGNDGLNPRHGYHVSLGTAKVNGDLTTTTFAYQARGGAPRLQIHAVDRANTNHGNDEICVRADADFEHDTWYHVRADLIPSVGADTINVYTAPISGAGSADTELIGNETWTLQVSTVIHAGHPCYIPWGDSSHDRCGYWGGSYSGSTKASGGRHVAMIDKYQFLAEDIS